MKPILKEGDSIQITVDLKWLVEFAKAMDRISYSCGGIFTCVNGHLTLCDKTLEFIQMETEDLQKEAR